jgi:hypothetical protein
MKFNWSLEPASGERPGSTISTGGTENSGEGSIDSVGVWSGFVDEVSFLLNKKIKPMAIRSKPLKIIATFALVESSDRYPPYLR